MIELEKVQRAKMYIDQLANGIDPITGKEYPNECVLNHVEIVRNLFYVSDILRQIIQDCSTVKTTGKKTIFYN